MKRKEKESRKKLSDPQEYMVTHIRRYDILLSCISTTPTITISSMHAPWVQPYELLLLLPPRLFSRCFFLRLLPPPPSLSHVVEEDGHTGRQGGRMLDIRTDRQKKRIK